MSSLIGVPETMGGIPVKYIVPKPKSFSVEELVKDMEKRKAEEFQQKAKKDMAYMMNRKKYQEETLNRMDTRSITEKNLDRFYGITQEMGATYYKKNIDYGNSFDDSLDEDGLVVAKIRLGDKWKRFGQLINNDAKVSDESKRDTLLDMANYAIMTVMWMDNKEDK